ncbi:MAG: hypothetical protein H7A25_06895 [Leptospiraceae bacterium]|nr:hypothetical protein [Leptospiraceae bacterium]MCP5499614.1 hypothetical protein [Leptospiraceae bacterium]
MSGGDEKILKKFEDLSYFDNRALYYLCNETPPPVLALAFLHGNEKVVGSMLGVLEPKRREYIHQLMSAGKEEPLKKKEEAVTGLLLIAEGLISRNLIQKKGQYYYGLERSK